jgi:hypothetical protein
VVVQLLISVLPGICSDLLRAYHNDWLGDVILIIFFTLRLGADMSVNIFLWYRTTQLS